MRETEEQERQRSERDNGAKVKALERERQISETDRGAIVTEEGERQRI